MWASDLPDLSGCLSMAQNHHHLQHLFDESNRSVLKLKNNVFIRCVVIIFMKTHRIT